MNRMYAHEHGGKVLITTFATAPTDADFARIEEANGYTGPYFAIEAADLPPREKRDEWKIVDGKVVA